MRPNLVARIIPAVACGLVAILAMPLAAGKKKNKEDVTQTLEAPPDPPAFASGETSRLVFHTAPLLSRGLLSQQIRDGLREILRSNNGMQIIKIRAFVAGTGDLRRVPQIVGEVFGEKKHLPLPAISVVQAGGLPVESAQISLETVSVAKRDVNPHGLVFIAPREHSSNESFHPNALLAELSVADIAAAVSGRAEVLSVTCFVSALVDAPRVNNAIAARFPASAINVIQNRRAASKNSVACEAVARVTNANAADAPRTTLLNSARVIFTGTQVAYGFSDDDARLAFRRLDHVLAGAGASLKTAARVSIYPLSPSIAEQTRRLWPEFLGSPDSGMLAEIPFESLPGMDASFALDAIAPATP